MNGMDLISSWPKRVWRQSKGREWETRDPNRERGRERGTETTTNLDFVDGAVSWTMVRERETKSFDEAIQSASACEMRAVDHLGQENGFGEE